MSGLTAEGFSRDRLDVIIANLTTALQGVHGSDVVLTADSEDGQDMGIQAEQIALLWETLEDVWASFDPTKAQGQALYALGLLCGISPKGSRNGVIAPTLRLALGATVYAGTLLKDTVTGVQYRLNADVGPASSEGEAFATTATAVLTGQTASLAGNAIEPVVQMFGLLSIDNLAADGTAGVFAETQEAFRFRRAASTAAPTVGIVDGLYGALANLDGIGHVHVFENRSSLWADAKEGDNALPPHSIAVVAQFEPATSGVSLIAQEINKRTMGCTMLGGTTALVTDTQGNARPIKYSIATSQPIAVTITYKTIPGQGFDPTDEATVKQALHDWIEANQDSGQDVQWSYLFAPAIAAVPGKTGNAIKIEAMVIGNSGGSLTAADIPVAYDHIATLSVGDVTMVAA